VATARRDMTLRLGMILQPLRSNPVRAMIWSAGAAPLTSAMRRKPRVKCRAPAVAERQFDDQKCDLRSGIVARRKKYNPQPSRV